ncbi:SMP-30/gluconolactonase/LRE family protein [Sphingomonas sp. DT-51]|uniref:SMP-30/gluconolactonase/LRE family protein n=1 Tax=Sphingomonas sp. DT-51 TaxID=3396165 RepID=UPI003F1A8DF1
MVTADVAVRNRLLATHLDQPEGPVALVNGDLLLVEMGEESACVTRLSPKGRTIVARPGGRPTGLAIDGDGWIWVAGGANNSLVRLSPEGRTTLVVEGHRGEPFLFPNDLAFGPDGMLYMTDSGMKPKDLIRGLTIRSDFSTASYDGRVFQIDPRSGEVTAQLAEGIRFANGIAFGPDDALYYAETLTGVIHRQEIGRQATPFVELDRLGPTDRFCGPDGMAFSASGRLYCAVYGERRVAVVDERGFNLPSIPINGDRPTNVAFVCGGTDLLVTEVEHGTVEVVQAAEHGAALWQPEVDS